MIMFVFQYVEKVTDNYHSGGGLMIIAKNLRQALEMVEAEPHVEITAEEWRDAEEFQLIDSTDYEPQIIVFPDAGCC